MRRRFGSILAACVATAGAIVWPTATTALAATPKVVINELHYHPLDDNPAGEYLELLNTTGSDIDLTGWCVDGIDYCFPRGSTVAGGGYVIVTGDRYEGALSNGGEDITLLDRSGAIVDFLEYDDKEEWPARADGEGDSLQRRDPSAASDTPGNWESHPPTPGTRNAAFAAGLLPTFSDVEHTELPAAGEPITQVLPCDATPGATSNINYDRPLATTNGLTIVEFGPTGRACVYTLAPAHIVADLQGYFADDAFEDVPDRRLLDSRVR